MNSLILNETSRDNEAGGLFENENTIIIIKRKGRLVDSSILEVKVTQLFIRGIIEFFRGLSVAYYFRNLIAVFVSCRAFWEWGGTSSFHFVLIMVPNIQAN